MEMKEKLQEIITLLQTMDSKIDRIEEKVKFQENRDEEYIELPGAVLNETIIYNKNDIKIVYLGFTRENDKPWDWGINLKIENNTSKDYTVECAFLSINNIETNECVLIKNIHAKKTIFDCIYIRNDIINRTDLPKNELSFKLVFTTPPINFLEDNDDIASKFETDWIKIIK